jgi:nucleoside-diphosphate-sugar epimerase
VKTGFVTGGTGFVGTNLVNELVSQGWDVTCLHRASSDLKYLRRHPVKLKVGDLNDAASLELAMPEGVDAVFHVAADTSSWSAHDATQTATNVMGTRNVVNAARKRGAKRFVFTSTASAYARQDGPLSEQSQSTAMNSWINYERSKWLSEEEVRQGVRDGLSAVIINPCAVFGPYDTSVWGSVFSVIKAGKLALIPPGSVPINHVAEVVRAHIAAVERGRTGENYILNGEHVSFATIFREMARVMGVELKAPVVPGFVFKGMARVAALVATIRGTDPDMTPEMADILCRDNRVETDKAERELGYRRVPLKQCVEDSYAWLKGEGLL